MDNTEKFSGKAEVYAHFRPGYPRECIDYLMKIHALPKGAPVAEFGAGTGILTEALLECGLTIIAVEPNDDMRRVLKQNLGETASLIIREGTAEASGLEAGSVSAIFAAQAFHWFDPDGFREECKRILKPGGKASLVWNNRDEEAEVIRGHAALLRRCCPDYPGFTGGRGDLPERYRRFFREGGYVHWQMQNDLFFDWEHFLGRNLSASYAPREEVVGYGEFLKELRRFFEMHADNEILRYPNRTEVDTGEIV